MVFRGFGLKRMAGLEPEEDGITNPNLDDEAGISGRGTHCGFLDVADFVKTMRLEVRACIASGGVQRISGPQVAAIVESRLGGSLGTCLQPYIAGSAQKTSSRAVFPSGFPELRKLYCQGSLALHRPRRQRACRVTTQSSFLRPTSVLIVASYMLSDLLTAWILTINNSSHVTLCLMER